MVEIGYVSVEDIGLSHEKRKMKVLKVCKGRAGCGKKPAIWIDGGMHAREWISPASVTYIVKKLLDDDKSKFTNRNLVENLDWYFLAVANPDGYEWSRTEDRLWRKNRLENILCRKLLIKLFLKNALHCIYYHFSMYMLCQL